MNKYIKKTIIAIKNSSHLNRSSRSQNHNLDRKLINCRSNLSPKLKLKETDNKKWKSYSNLTKPRKVSQRFSFPKITKFCVSKKFLNRGRSNHFRRGLLRAVLLNKRYGSRLKRKIKIFWLFIITRAWLSRNKKKRVSMIEAKVFMIWAKMWTKTLQERARLIILKLKWSNGRIISLLWERQLKPLKDHLLRENMFDHF